MSRNATKVYVLGNPEKPQAPAALERVRGLLGERCELVGAELSLDGSHAVSAKAERVVVLGGDGTVISVARTMGASQIPLIGVNVGKLGFLTEFSLSELEANLDRALTDDALISRRSALQVAVQHDGGVRATSIAVNDCVIHAGPPYRMINLTVAISGDRLTDIWGDGLIVCTPSGSTAHNLSAGGPIMQPDVDAMILTPLAPHSLTHKPLVIDRSSVVEVTATVVNAGTTAIVDGQVSCALMPGDRVVIRRFEEDVLVVRNPRNAKWHNLVTKLHWGQALG